MTRRLKKDLIKLFADALMDERDRRFINGCLRCQQNHPQLTANQWSLVKQLEEKYKNGKSS